MTPKTYLMVVTVAAAVGYAVTRDAHQALTLGLGIAAGTGTVRFVFGLPPLTLPRSGAQS